MPRPFAHFLKTLVVVFALVAIPAAFAQTKPPSLIGKSRDQIVAQLGEPKSNIKAGTREMLFFAHLKVTLRNDVVIETEELVEEPAPRHVAEPAPSAANSAAAAGAPAGQAAAATTANSPAPAPAGADAAAGKPAPEANSAPAKPPAPAQPELEIKFVKPASSSAKAAPHPASAAAVAAQATAPATPVPAPAAESKPQLTPPLPPAAAPAPAATVANPPEVTTATAAAPEPEQPTVAEEVSAPDQAAAKAALDLKKKAALRKRWWRFRRDTETEEEPVSIFSAQSYAIAGIILIGGAGYLWWRQLQRRLELEATSVSSTLLEATVAADPSTQFTADSVGKLGQRRFERLVASYYAKTGVVAERTKAGPEAPVHIKIFWKGEPKPFAGVLCLANPPALVGPQRLEELAAALAAADIRRGYVVTTGKFNVEARDMAEEKHFTLLSGDLFLEKLNALPPAARADLLKDTNLDEPAPPSALA